MCYHDFESQNVPANLYWTVYTLDCRWSFGTGLPYAVSDIEINRRPLFSVIMRGSSTRGCGSPVKNDQPLSSAYLKQMMGYCGIASEVRRRFLAQPSADNQSTINQDAARDYSNFRVVQWLNSLSLRLRFGGIGDKYDPSREKRGHYKLRLMLNLRASQMRTFILRKSAASSGLTSCDFSGMQTMLEMRRDESSLTIPPWSARINQIWTWVASHTTKPWSPIANLTQDSPMEPASAYTGFGPYGQQQPNITMSHKPPNAFTSHQNHSSTSDNSSSCSQRPWYRCNKMKHEEGPVLSSTTQIHPKINCSTLLHKNHLTVDIKAVSHWANLVMESRWVVRCSRNFFRSVGPLPFSQRPQNLSSSDLGCPSSSSSIWTPLMRWPSHVRDDKNSSFNTLCT